MEEVPKPPYVVERVGSRNLYYRRRFPDDVAAHLRRSDYNKSLGVSAWKDAGEPARQHERKYHLAVQAAQREIHEAHERISQSAAREQGIIVPSRIAAPVRPTDPSLPLLTDLDARRLARDYLLAARSEVDALPPDEAVDGQRRDEYVMEVEDRIAMFRAPEDIGTMRVVQSIEADLLTKAGMRADFLSPEAQLLRELVRRAALQIARMERRHLDGDYSKGFDDVAFLEPVPASPIYTPPLSVRNGPTFGDVQQAYLDTIFRKGQTEKTKDRYRAEMKHIMAFFGSETALASLTKAACEGFAGVIGKLPPNFEDLIRGGADLRSIAANRTPDAPVLSYATQEKYLSQLSRFCGWASGHDYIAKNYADGLIPNGKKPDGSVARMPFTDEDLQRIFRRPIYTGCRDDRHGFSEPGDAIIRRARYWAPVIALFSGLRCGEILQLTPAHFRVSDAGTPFIVLTKDMKLKNQNAEREIPVHPMLVKIGLLDWVGRRRSRAEQTLFPEVPINKYGDASSGFAKWYRSDLTHFGLGDRRPLLSFHSFRHTFKRALDRAKVREDMKDEICGWTRNKNIGRRYGTGLEADVLLEAVQSVSYNLDLMHLTAHGRLKD
jgi:integrase